MLKAEAPIGTDNDRMIVNVCKKVRTLQGKDGEYEPILCAWGAYGMHDNRDRKVFETVRDMGMEPMCLAVNKNGTPKHPLYCKADLTMQPYPGRP